MIMGQSTTFDNTSSSIAATTRRFNYYDHRCMRRGVHSGGRPLSFSTRSLLAIPARKYSAEQKGCNHKRSECF